MNMKQLAAMIVLFVAVGTAMAVIILPFTSWDDLTKKSPDIIIARCASAPNPTVIGDGMIWSDIEVLAVLKGDTKPEAARMVSLYWPHQDERFLMFANYQSNQLYRAYNATETYRIVPLNRYFMTNELAGKSLDERIQLLLRRRLEDVNTELERNAKEKHRLEANSPMRARTVPLVLAADAVPPNKYSLSVGRVYESKPERPEWVFIFGGTSAIRGGETVCKSPATLKTLLKGLPSGSTLDWWPTCEGDSEALAGHLDDLKKVCTEAGIVFAIHPAG